MVQVTTLAQRVQISELAKAGLSDAAIAAQVGCSRWTVRKWRRREEAGGRAALDSVRGRPRAGVWDRRNSELRTSVLAWRTQHPGWGAKTLLAELRADPRFVGQALPSLRTLNRLLAEAGLQRRQARHAALPQPERVPPQAPHEEWEIDARGHEYVPHVGVVELVNLNDVVSHTRLLSYPCLLGDTRLTRRANTEDYQLLLRIAFLEWGLPQRLKSDHHRLFYESKSAAPFPTRLHLWLLGLGVTLVFGRVHCPTDQALTERSHQLWEQQVLRGQTFRDWQHLYDSLQQRRPFLNQQLPCATLEEQPPMLAFPATLTNPRLYRPEWEVELFDLTRIHRYLAQGRWFRRVSTAGTISLGGQVYYLTPTLAHQQVEITFDLAQTEWCVRRADDELIRHLAPRGLTHQELLGELHPLLGLPSFQLALPLSDADWRAARLSGTLSGTT